MKKFRYEMTPAEALYFEQLLRGTSNTDFFPSACRDLADQLKRKDFDFFPGQLAFLHDVTVRCLTDEDSHPAADRFLASPVVFEAIQANNKQTS